MAGPVASIILSTHITEEQRLFIRKEIIDISSHIEGDDFWVQERPFIVIIGPEYEEEIDDYIDNGLHSLIGWTPKDIVGFAAMCNQHIDHHLLAEICLRFARKLDGLIDFDGELQINSTNTPGELLSVQYVAASGKECIYHVGNVEFLDWWIKQPEFRMIK